MLTRTPGAFPILTLALAAPCHAAINLSSDFSPGQFWQPFTATSGIATQLFSGGNPGGYMSVEPWLGGAELNAGTAGGYRSQFILPTQQPDLTHILIDGDVRYLDGIAGGRLVPVIQQFGRTFIPSTPGELISGSAWSHTATRSYAISSFVQVGLFQGQPPSALVLEAGINVGFGVRITGQFGAGPPTSRYAVDNLNLVVVPAPTGAAALGGAWLLVRRRRS